MQTITLNVENEKVKWALELFFDNYKEAVVQFINNVLKQEGLDVDSYVSKETTDGVSQITIYQTAPDKGYVLGVDSNNTVQVSAYKDVADQNLYVIYDGDKLSLYIKRNEGADLKVGGFQNINDVVTQIASESVKAAVETRLKVVKDNEKMEADIARKERVKKLAKNDKE